MVLNVVPQERRIEVETAFGTIEGLVRCHPSVRTMDDLNFPSADYLMILEPCGSGVNSRVAEARGPIAIQKDSILFLRELSEGLPTTSRADPEKCWVSVVEYRVGSFVLRGTVSYPPGGEPLARLNLREHKFLALTSVSVTGPGREFVAPFLAVNRQHLLAAWELDGVAETVAVR